jgi:polyisoprenoid-binding protein YceI
MNSSRRIAAALVLAFTSSSFLACSSIADSTPKANSNWSIDQAQSSLNFVSTKAGQPGTSGISEVSDFKRFSGGLSPTGQITLVIDLSSINSGIGIRDERMQTMLWNVQATRSDCEISSSWRHGY